MAYVPRGGPFLLLPIGATEEATAAINAGALAKPALQGELSWRADCRWRTDWGHRFRLRLGDVWKAYAQHDCPKWRRTLNYQQSQGAAWNRPAVVGWQPALGG